MKRERESPSNRTKTFTEGESDSFELHTDETSADEDTILLPETGNTVKSDESIDVPSSKARQFGRYALLELLASGSAGEVYRALHVRLRKPVAIRILAKKRADDEYARQRFAREVRWMCGLDHPNLVRMETAGQHDGVSYLVMEYVSGLDLQRLLSCVGRLRPADACQLIGQAALGLDHLHRHGMIQGDIKPSHLILTPSGLLKLVDCGMVCQADSQETLAPFDPIVGNPHYIAPEYLGVDPETLVPDIRGDVYALGRTLYTLIAGPPPYANAESGLPELLAAKLPWATPPLVDLRADLPAGLSELVNAMIARDPRDRIAVPMQVAAALTPFAAGCDLPALIQRVDLAPQRDADVPSAFSTAEHLQRQTGQSERSRRNSPLVASRWKRVAATVSLIGFAAATLSFWRGPAADESQSTLPDAAASVEAFPPIPVTEFTHDWDSSSTDLVPHDIHESFDVVDQLLASIDPGRDAFDVRAQQTDGGWVFTNLQQRGIVQLPVAMPESYTLDFSVERLEGEGSFGIGFSVGSGRLLAVIDHRAGDGWQSGMYFVDSGGKSRVADAYTRRLLSDDTSLRLRLKVSPSRAQLLCLHDHDPLETIDQERTDSAAEKSSTESISTWHAGIDLDLSATATSTPAAEPTKPQLGRVDSYYPHTLFVHVHKGSFRVDDVRIHEAMADPTPIPFMDAGSTVERRLAQRIVWRGGHVEVITDTRTKTVHSLKDLTDKPWLVGVEKCPHAAKLMIGDVELMQLAKIDGVRKLDLGDAQVTAEGVAALSGMRSLGSLTLPRHPLDDFALASLRDLPELRELQLIGMSLSEDDMDELARFPQLTSLCLSSSNVTDRGAELVAKSLPNLRHLCLSGTQINGTCLPHLYTLRALDNLQLAETKVDDRAIENLPELPMLRTLILKGSRVTADAIETLRQERSGLSVN